MDMVDNTVSLNGDHEECFRQLREISDALDSAIHNVEDRFLETGERLMNISGKAADLSAIIQKAHDILDDPEHGVLAEYLRIQNSIMDKLNQLTDFVRNGQDEIQIKNEQISRFRETCSFISVTSRNLSIIALNIKVQSGHLNEQEDSFFSFGKEIKGLARELADVSNAINTDSIDTQSKQREQIKLIDGELRQYEQYIEESSGDWDRIRSRMMLEIQELIPGFQKANECTDRIAGEISSLIIALQGHDIARQKVEHVCEILNEIASGVREPKPDTLVLQGRQLDQVLKELSRIKVTGVSAFTVIHKMLSDLMKFIANDREDALSLGVILEDSLSGLLTLVQYLDDGQAICSRIANSIDDAMGKVQQLEQYVEKARDVNKSLEIKAINAIVMTAGLKKRSRPFRVLGQHVNDLSRKSIVFADKIKQIIESIVEDRRSGSIGTLQKEHEGIKEEVAELRKQYENLHEQIELSSSGSKNLQDSILRAGDSLVFINGLIDSIQKQTRLLNEVYCKGTGRDIDLDSDAADRYTMESEREVYRKVYGRDPDEGGNAEIGKDDSVTLF